MGKKVTFAFVFIGVGIAVTLSMLTAPSVFLTAQGSCQEDFSNFPDMISSCVIERQERAQTFLHTAQITTWLFWGCLLLVYVGCFLFLNRKQRKGYDILFTIGIVGIGLLFLLGFVTIVPLPQQYPNDVTTVWVCLLCLLFMYVGCFLFLSLVERKRHGFLFTIFTISIVVGVIIFLMGFASEISNPLSQLNAIGTLLVMLGIGFFAVTEKSKPAPVPLPASKPQDEELLSLQQAVQANPQSYEVWTNLGFRQHELGQDDEALASANKAISLNKTYARAWMVRGAALSTMERKEDDALTACNEAIRLDPQNVDAMYYKGKVLGFQERDADAHEMFDRVLAHDPMYKDALLSKGTLYLAADNFDDNHFNGALTTADMLIRRLPDDAMGWRMQGQAYEAKGEQIGAAGNYNEGLRLLNQAITSFDRALEIDPLFAPTYLLKAQPYVAIEDYGKALEILNQGLKIEPNNKLLQEAKADIVEKRTSETGAKIAKTAGRMAVGGGIGLAKGTVGVAKIFFDALRKS